MKPDSITYDVRYIICGVPYWSRDHSLECVLKECSMLENDMFCDGYEMIKIEHFETKEKQWKRSN